MKNTTSKIVHIVIFSLLITCNLQAQIAYSQNGNIDVKAKEILTSVANKIVTAKGISFISHIVIKNPNKQEKSKQEAKVLLSKNKYRISVENQTFYCDGETIWHHNKETNEVTINKIGKEEDNILNPAQLLANYEKNFKAKFIREEENDIYVIDLTPKKGKDYHKIRLYIDKKDMQLKKMEMQYYDTSRIEYRIEQYKSNVKSTDKDFVFDSIINKGVEIIDMR